MIVLEPKEDPPNDCELNPELPPPLDIEDKLPPANWPIAMPKLFAPFKSLKAINIVYL